MEKVKWERFMSAPPGVGTVRKILHRDDGTYLEIAVDQAFSSHEWQEINIFTVILPADTVRIA